MNSLVNVRQMVSSVRRFDTNRFDCVATFRAAAAAAAASTQTSGSLRASARQESWNWLWPSTPTPLAWRSPSGPAGTSPTGTPGGRSVIREDNTVHSLHRVHRDLFLFWEEEEEGGSGILHQNLSIVQFVLVCRYVKLYMLPGNGGKMKTTCKKNTTHPVFNEVLKVKLYLSVVKHQFVLSRDEIKQRSLLVPDSTT